MKKKRGTGGGEVPVSVEQQPIYSSSASHFPFVAHRAAVGLIVPSTGAAGRSKSVLLRRKGNSGDRSTIVAPTLAAPGRAVYSRSGVFTPVLIDRRKADLVFIESNHY